MPSIVTHHYFAKDVFEELPREIKNSFNSSLDIYYLFAQSFDNLFYYKFFTPWQGREIRKLGTKAQQTKVNLYFKNILNEITNLDLKNNSEVLAYLYGSICHYCLDSTAHPFIIYESGHIDADKKYRGNHEKVEVTIDAYIYEKKERKPLRKENLANQLLPKKIFPKPLKEVLTNVYKSTFHFQNMAEIYEKSIHTGNFLLNYFVTDRTGFKKILYTIKDTLSFESKRRYANLSFHVTKIQEDYLNKNHTPWHHPVTNEIHHDSFEDLYNQALQKAKVLITEIHTYLHSNHKDIKQLLQIIGNLSYATGLDCNQKKPLSYFKY